jgi:hypothetical protein
MMVNYALAQPTITWHSYFDSLYTLNSYGVNIIESEDSSYTSLSYYKSKQTIIHLTKLGDTVWTKKFNTNLFLRSLIKTNDGGYAIMGNINGWSLIKMDSLGDTLWTKAYPQLSDPRCVIQTSDGGFAISGYQHPELIKTDGQGNIEWIGNTFNGIHVQGQIECKNRELLLYGNSGFNPYTYKAALFDSTGTLKWVNAYGYVTFLAADLESILSAVQLPDSNFIFGCSIDTTVEGQYNLLKVRYSDGLLLDSVESEDLFLNDYSIISLTSDNNILIRTQGYISKTSVQFTNLWWKVLPFFVTSISETSDNGFIACGANVIQPSLLSRIEYAKLDSLGNIYNFQGIPYITQQLLSVYPNPASDQLTASPPSAFQGRGEVTLTIYDMLGKVQLQQSLIPQGDFNVDVNALPSGIYMLQLKQEERLFNGRFIKE